MDYNPMMPIWAQVAASLKKQIAAGKIPPGEKLPGGRDLALRYSINPNTAARVYQELEREGLCFTRRGMGTFVTEDEERIRLLRNSLAQQAFSDFIASTRDLGMTVKETAAMLKTFMEEENVKE